MKKIGLVGALFAVAAIVALTVAPAQAEHQYGHCDTAIHHPSDPDAFGSGYPNSYACEWWNRYIRVCDRHVDGHRVRAHFHGQFSRDSISFTGWAPSQGCITQGTAYGPGNIVDYRVCVEYEGCSAWRKPY